METVKPNFRSVQDLPPPGGYPKINTARGIRPRGPSGYVLIFGSIFLAGLGLYRISEYRKFCSLRAKEKREIKMAIEPFLQAEVDRKYSRELQEQLEREAEIMKNVPGWEVGKPAYVKRWRRPLLDRSAGDWLGPEAPIYKPEK